MHVGVNSWISMDGQVTRTSHSDSHPQLWMTVGRSVSAKSAKMTWHSEWTPHREKFFEKSFWALSSWNRRWKGIWSEEDKTLEWRGFWDGVDLHFSAIDMTNVNKRERGKKETIRKAPNSSNIASILKREYVCIENAWTCDMQKKLYHGLSPIQSYQQIINLHISKCMIILLIC